MGRVSVIINAFYELIASRAWVKGSDLEKLREDLEKVEAEQNRSYGGRCFW